MPRESKSYTLLIALFCAFGLVIYGAYSPARKAQKQQVICVKFKNGLKNEAVEQYLHDFAALKPEIKQIVGYTAGKTILAADSNADYDVVHYLTFQSAGDIRTFEQSAAYRNFVVTHRRNLANVLVVNADIQP